MSRNRIDLTGKKFGRLTVVRYEETTEDGRARWFCVCECGNTKVVNSRQLREGKTKSCGCLQNESRAKTLRILRDRKHNIAYSKKHFGESMG